MITSLFDFACYKMFCSQPNDYGPDTLLSFMDSKLEVSFSLGKNSFI